jgi:glycosyltransferase involved in cell wall biosynthesis
VLVLPSIAATETFGLVQVEAHVSGIPTICTNLPTGVTRVTRDEVTGLVVPRADSAALASALRRLLSDNSLRSRLGEAAQ